METSASRAGSLGVVTTLPHAASSRAESLRVCSRDELAEMAAASQGNLESLDLAELTKKQPWWRKLFGQESGPSAEKYSAAAQLLIGCSLGPLLPPASAVEPPQATTPEGGFESTARRAGAPDPSRGRLRLGRGPARCTGFIFQKVGKLAATAVGGGFFLLQLANHTGYIKVDWQRVEKDMKKAKEQLQIRKSNQLPTEVKSKAEEPAASSIVGHEAVLLFSRSCLPAVAYLNGFYRHP
ncbi:FUN14 domain-containing protein 2 [Galemys pyrenaicus]|uniref:FUN14 domain-containing protein 2 n=1 Tax=Galemys pyrenaicus TaxID=202257 RepID=A0A8J6AGM8_GALPY|nr:FUN14 domain-containing protein 2 [Galemys pyrenaicus]